MKTLTLSLLSTLLLSHAHAASIQLDEVTVEAANRTGQKAKDLTETITIITAEEIKESRVTSLADALNRLGNIAMVSNGGLGQNSSFLLRGMDSRNTLVLIDGMRYNDVTGLSGAQFSHIMLGDIEQIEIIKGAQSGIWGADASAGVINIVTKGAQKGTHLSVHTEAGSFNTQQGSVQISHKTEVFDILATVSRIKTDGFSAAEPDHGTADYGKRGDDLGYEDDAYTNNTYTLKLGVNITDEDRIEASFRRIDTFTEYDGRDYSTNQSLDAENYVTTLYGTTAYFEKIDNRFFSGKYTHKDKIHDISLQYNHSSFKRLVQDFTGRIEELSLQDRINYGENSFLRIGGSYQGFKHENNYGSAFDKGYHGNALFATNYNKFSFFDQLGKTMFTQSLRFDDYNAFKNTTTGKLGLKQFVSDDIFLSSNYGTAYNAPSLYQLYAPSFTDYFSGLPVPVGNDSLRPEETQTLDFTLGNDNLTLTYFYNKITNLIEYDYVLGYQNATGTSTIKGVELGYKDDFFDLLALNVNYTYLDAKNADGEFLLSRPKHQIDANLVYYVSQDLNIGLNGQFIGERYDQNDRQGAQTGKYTLYNTVVNYTINDNFTLYAKVDNIGDKYYQVRDGYATAERSYYAGLTAKF